MVWPQANKYSYFFSVCILPALAADAENSRLLMKPVPCKLFRCVRPLYLLT